MEASPILSSLRPKPSIVKGLATTEGNGVGCRARGGSGRRRRGGGSGLARTPGGVDGVAPASTRILWTYQAILIVSSGCKPADLIILGVPGPRRNERAMAFPGVDSVIGSNSGLAWLHAVLRHGRLRRMLILSRESGHTHVAFPSLVATLIDALAWKCYWNFRSVTIK